MQRDKKRRDDQLVFVLLPSIGQTKILSGFSEELLTRVWLQTIADMEQG
jgi:3-dehydroquinate synthetase